MKAVKMSVEEIEKDQAIEEAESMEPVRVVTPRKPGHYVVRQMSGFPGPMIIGEYTDENSWRDAQDKFRSTHGHVELWQIFTGPKGVFRFFISGKKSSGRAAILN